MNKHRLSSFTDVLSGDSIIDDSQPLSLSPPNNVVVSSRDSQETILVSDINTFKMKRPERGTGQRGNFRSKEEIDEKYRDVFTHPYFNLMQSRVIDDALYSDKSLVVCAPTGSGKTVLFEMAIVQLLMDIEDKNIGRDFKIIYMAPMKALCTERLTEWYRKFTKLGLLCIEVTGDTDVDFPQLHPYRIIITTPEKWDMLTRRWKDHSCMVDVIKLFLIDEVHILNDEARGPVLEAVVSRMKTIESSAKSAHRIRKVQRQQRKSEDAEESPAPGIRFVAVSATVSNPKDVATWLSTPDSPAVFHKFGDECRPVRLKLVVEGFACAPAASAFKFDISLNYKLWPIIQKYHNGKPTLIFCNTRKSVMLTAEALAREITVGATHEQRAKLQALAATIKNKKIQSLILNGVGCHHAGLLYEERVNIENAFRNRDLPILITTTTLAMGVNLPAHLVIIKNTQQYINGAYQEYSISTILQMVGRAGRPQFDTEATAVIMTRNENKARYQSLVGGSEPLQSYLHKRLAENLNSEAALGSVTDVADCVQWINSTFLSVRAVRDPRRYLGLPQNASKDLITKKIEELCVRAMHGLNTSGLISMDEACCIQSTDAGRLMSLYYIDIGTMKDIMKIEGTETLERLLWLVCECHELADMHLRVDERRCLNLLNRNKAAATIRFPMKGKISTRQMKLNCIIQAVLGCLPILEPSLNQEAVKIMRIADRVCKCLVAYVTSAKVRAEKPKCYSAVLNAITLAKCISAHLWENSPLLSKQLKGIGPTFSSLLASAGKTTFLLLEESHPRDLERIMNKGPPAGNVLRKQISMLPKYRLTLVPIDDRSVRTELALLNKGYLNENTEHLTAIANHKFYLIVGDSENNLLHYSTLRDTDFINAYDGCFTCDITRRQNNKYKVLAHCISSTFVGIDDNSEFVFKDLTPQLVNNINKLKCTPSETVLKQTNITDTFTRKRKNPREDIVEPKEKKKRESSFLKKFQNLRDSVGITSNNHKEDLNKTTELSNRVLNDSKPCMSVEPLSNCQLDSTSRNDFNDDIIELSEPEDWVDDVASILNAIENEIAKNKQTNSTQPERTKDIYNHPSTSSINSMYTKPFSTNKNKRRESKNNFSFIDSIKKKSLINDEPPVEESDMGLSSPVRDNLNRFLMNLQNENSDQVNIDQFLESIEPENSKTIANDKNQEVENIMDKHSNTKVDRLTDQDIQENVGGRNELKQQANKDKIETNVNAQQIEIATNKASREAICLSMPKGSEVCENSSKALPIRPMINKRDATFTETNRIINRPTYVGHHTLKINPFLAIQSPIPSTTNNFNNILFDMQQKKQAEGRSNYSDINNSKLVAISNFASTHAISVPLQNEVNKYHILEILEPNSVRGVSKNNDGANFDYTNKENVDINQYFFSATKTNACTKVLPERQLHIVSRVKVDMNVMEIRSKSNNSENFTENDENYQNVDISQGNYEGNKRPDYLYDVQGSLQDANLADTELINCEDVLMPNKPADINSTKAPSTEGAEIIQNKLVDVKDVLRKYQKLYLSKNSQLSQNTNRGGFKSESCKNEVSKETRKNETKPKRKYRIKDMETINIPFPEGLASVITEPNTSLTSTNIFTALNKIKENVTEYNTLKVKETNNLQLNTEEVKETCLSPKTPELDIKYEKNELNDTPPLRPDIDIQEDFDLSQAVLNPKTLLQTMNEALVPPPPEFADTYSPTFDNDDFNNFSYHTNPDAVSEDINYEPNVEQSEREEWILPRGENSYYSDHTSHTFSLSDNLSQRQTKLNNFKFIKKNCYKFKK